MWNKEEKTKQETNMRFNEGLWSDRETLEMRRRIGSWKRR